MELLRLPLVDRNPAKSLSRRVSIYVFSFSLFTGAMFEGRAGIQSPLHAPSYLAASNIDSLRSTDITFVLTIMSSDLSAPTLQEHLDLGIVTARFNKDDKPAEDLLSIFGSTCDLIEEKRAEGKKVLVHCRMGISRSVTLVMAYRMCPSSCSCRVRHGMRHGR